jgi:carbonic anhydrase
MSSLKNSGFHFNSDLHTVIYALIRQKTLVLISLAAFLFVSKACSPEVKEVETDAEVIDVSDIVVRQVLNVDDQRSLTPERILENFKAGNERFRNNDLTARDHSAQVRESAMGQYPKAFVLSCVDSRIPVEDVFDMGIGDIFVGRVAGNFVNEDLLGSMEFATGVAGAKLILVLGHEHCGAVKAAIDNVELGNITSLVRNIRPAVEHSHEYEGDQTSDNQDFVSLVGYNNVVNTMTQIRERSEMIRELEAEGKVKIVGGFYNMYEGEVEFIESPVVSGQ